MPNLAEIFVQSFIGIAGIPAIVAIVNLVKGIKDFGNYNNVIACLVGIIINVVGVWTFDMVSKVNIVSAIAVGVLAGLAASGLYTLKKV
jgi:hypothetical protein